MEYFSFFLSKSQRNLKIFHIIYGKSSDHLTIFHKKQMFYGKSSDKTDYFP